MTYLEDERVTLSKGSVDKTGAKIYGTQANVPEHYVVELQQHLLALGFGPGSADGFFGSRTDEALRAFQEAALGGARVVNGRSVAVPVTYLGEVNGECGGASRKEIGLWLDHGYRSFWPLPPVWIGPEEPLQENRIAFAEPSAAAIHWPIRTRDRGGREVAYRGVSGTAYGRGGRRFLASRASGRFHVGVDLWAEQEDLVVACEDGSIVNHYLFYDGVHALIVQCDSGLVINYGEVEADSWREFDLDIGSRVRAGQPIALVGRMTNSAMCHFETYRAGTTRNCRYFSNQPAPSALLNPTRYLLHLAAREYPQDLGDRAEIVLPPPPPSPAPTASPVEIDSPPAELTPLVFDRLPHFTGLERFHAAFAGGVRWRLTPQGIEVEGSGIERTPGEPRTVTRIWESYGESINRWAEHFQVPCALIVATIATETSGRADAVREEPGFTSDAQSPHRVSAGLMQTLISTARATLGDNTIDRHWLLVPDHSIQAGTGYIAEQQSKTGYDPPKVACAYNAGSLIRNAGRENRWKMKQYPIGKGDHCDRFVKWFNDAVAVLAKHGMRAAIPYDVYLV